jgi:hypothetical protein
MNAIEDALIPFNVRITQTPLTPQALVALIHGNGTTGH